MSRENVEIAKRSLEAYTRRDLDALRALNHSDVEVDWSASMGPDAGVYRGFEAAMGLYTSYFDAFEEIIIEPERFIDAGESVVVPNQSRSRGRNGIEVFARSTFTLTIREGKVARLCLHQETDQALKALGRAS